MIVQGRGRVRGRENGGRLKREGGLWGRIGNRERKDSKIGRDIQKWEGCGENRWRREKGGKGERRDEHTKNFLINIGAPS